MTAINHAHQQDQPVTPAERVLYDLADDYFNGCQHYHAAPQPDSPLRVFWRIRLIVLAEIGERLAAALDVAAPDWQALKELAQPEEATR